MEKKIYRLPSNLKSMAVQGLIGGIVLSLFTTYAALFAPPLDKSQLAPMYCVLLLGYGGVAFFIWLLRVCNIYLEVTDDHITQHAPNKPPLTLAWSDISEVKNNASMQRLELRSRSKNAAIMVEHQVEDFDALRQIIASKTQNPLA